MFNRENTLYKSGYKMTPVGRGAAVWYKRDDLFMPFEDSPINGTKLRQLIWLMNNQAKGRNVVVSAASVKSPQLPMVARVSKAYGKRVELFIGSNNLAAAVKNPMVALAKQYGATLFSAPCAYNSALQNYGKKRAAELNADCNQAYFLEYGISTTNPELWKDFYSFGGMQVRNLPPEVMTITMTAGSCNSILCVMIGLDNIGMLGRYKFNLVGVGPSKYKLLKERFEYVTGKPLPENQITYFPLHEDKVYTYDDKQPCTYDNIVFHPRYEGKMMHWLLQNRPDILEDTTNLIWIVGSEPCL